MQSRNSVFDRFLPAVLGLVIGIFIGLVLSSFMRDAAAPVAVVEKAERKPSKRIESLNHTVTQAPASLTPEGETPASVVFTDRPWRLEKRHEQDLKKRLADLRKRLQAAEHARAVFATKETPETSAVKVEIKAASEPEKRRFWQALNNEIAQLEPELRTFYEVDARRLLDQFLAFPKKHRVLVVVTHLPKSGGHQEVHFVFDTDSPQDFVLSDDVVVKTPPSIQLLNYITPWRDQLTHEPSERYGYLVKMESW